ncbi:MAG TPA: hypothetical protein VIR82_18085 [Bradyrhizobium sp.]|jgi:hypothetical protein
MIDLIAIAIGVIPAILYIGFFALKVPSTPLTVIVVISLALMVYSFFTDMRSANTAARVRADRE